MRSASALVLSSLLFAACLDDGPIASEDAGGTFDAGDLGTIYDRLGGEAVVRRVVSGLILEVDEDPRINGFFLNASVDRTRLERCLLKFVTAATGGPATYPGSGAPADSDGCRNMVDAHTGLGISTNDFADLAEHLVGQLREEGAAESDIAQIQNALAPLAEQIVENPDNNETIYLRALRKPGIESIIDNFLARVIANPAINGYFLNEGLDTGRLATCLIRQVCQATGGPCRYGEEVGFELYSEPCKPMQLVHDGLGISTADFSDLAVDLVDALENAGVPRADIDTIITVIGPLADEIVEDPTNDANTYQRMGRKPEVRRVIDNFIPRVLADPKINGYFLNASLDASRLTTCLVRQVCGATGGPCKYGLEVAPELPAGGVCRAMLETHQGLNISTLDFLDLAQHLLAAFDEETTLSSAEINTFIGALAGLQADIVEAPNNNETLYHRAGRKVVIETVIDDFVGRVVTDPKINGYFLNSDLNVARLDTCLVRQVCAVTGGPCAYGQEAGPELFEATPCRGMRETHLGLGISTADFSDLANALVLSLTSSSPLSRDDIDSIVRTIAPLSDEIVEDENNDESIYQRIGRKPAVQVVINDLLDRVEADPTLTGFFIWSREQRLATCLIRQVCSATGGPCKYGLEAAFELFDDTPCRDMTASHLNATNPPGGTGAPITRADFDALVGHLIDAMNASGAVDPADRDAIVGALAPLCPQIVAGGTGC
jgi:hemoglobin